MKRGPDNPITILRATGNAQWVWKHTKMSDEWRKSFFQSCIDKCDLEEPSRTVWLKAFAVLRDHSRKQLLQLAGDRYTLMSAFRWEKEKEKQRIKISERRARNKSMG